MIKAAIECLQERVRPVLQARVAVSLLFGVGVARVFQPVSKQLFVLLQYQELPEHHVGLKPVCLFVKSCAAGCGSSTWHVLDGVQHIS